MGYNGDSAPTIVLDIETAAHPQAADWLPEPKADARLKDTEKIARDIADKRAAMEADAPLDPYLCRIVCLGWLYPEHTEMGEVNVVNDEAQETNALHRFWRELDGRAPRFVTFNGVAFDWPVILTRSRLLGIVPTIDIDLRKYGNRQQIDLYQRLTFDGAGGKAVMSRRLQQLARRFGLPVEDETCGADVAGMVERGEWEAIAAHCESDLRLTYALARRCGFVA